MNLSLSCAFGCPMEGPFEPAAVPDRVARFADLGVRRSPRCDTTGMADPLQVLRLCGDARSRFPTFDVTARFHDTRGLGGIGGCPCAPGASGTVATEDLVHRLAGLGLGCGLGVERLAAAAATLHQRVGHELPAAVGRAGPRWQRHAPPADFGAIRERALARA